VTAAREYAPPRRKHLPRHVRRDAESPGGVFRVGDDAVHPTFTDEPRHLAGHGLAPRLAYNVADEENSHLLGYVGITAFTDDRDLDLAGIRQLLLDLAGQVAGPDGACYVRVRLFHHA